VQIKRKQLRKAKPENVRVALLEQVFYDCLLGTMGNMTEEQMKVYCRVANFVGHDDGE
jgi:hypothetical protein